MGVLLFDADSDGDLDLYVVSGGNEFKNGSTYYKDRLYSNDGKGNFKLSEGSLPANPVSGSCVIAADFDQDGDLDLFVGGRLMPQNYPSPGSSQLLENRGGKFVDVTDEKAPGLKHIGMVTAALWSDWDNDGWVDLLVVGEWMPVTVFKNISGRLENQTDALNLGMSRGWWNSITGADLNGDGYVEYILGNLGTNSRYKTSPERPLQIHQYDFDANGTEEAIISYVQAGKRYPIHPRDDIFQQIPSLRRILPSYRSYAEVTVDELFQADTWRKARTLSVDTFYSSILRNGKGKTFTLEKLPNEAQVSPVYGVVATDVNADGKADLILTGNSYATEVLTGNYDASYGTLLLGNDSGKFTPHPTIPFAGGETKGIATLFDGTLGSFIHLVAQTDGPLNAFFGPIEYREFLQFPSEAAYALIHMENGSLIKKEAYWGSGYLSQSGRYVAIPSDANRIDFYSWKGDLIAGR